MKRIALLMVVFAVAGTVFSAVVVPTVQAAWYPCPVNGCRGHNSVQAVWDHYGRRDPLTAVQRDNLGMLERQHRLGDEYNLRSRVERAIVHGDVWQRGGGYVYGNGAAAPRRTIFHPIEAGVLAAGITGTIRGNTKDAVLAGVSAYGATRIVDYFLQKREQRRLEQPEVRMSIENTFRTNTVTVEYRDRKGPKVVYLGPGQRTVITVLAGLGITARIDNFRRRNGRIEVKILQPGDGMEETVSGWVFGR